VGARPLWARREVSPVLDNQQDTSAICGGRDEFVAAPATRDTARTLTLPSTRGGANWSTRAGRSTRGMGSGPAGGDPFDALWALGGCQELVEGLGELGYRDGGAGGELGFALDVSG
jgi:hypothetical protein